MPDHDLSIAESMCCKLQGEVEKLQRDLTETGIQARLDKQREEHGRLLQAEASNHAIEMRAAKASAPPLLPVLCDHAM